MADIKVTFVTTAQVGIYLDRAVATGLYGMTRSEAAERMVAAFIEDLIQNATIEEIDAEADKEDD